MSGWSVESVEEALKTSRLFSWKKSTTRSKEWDNFCSIFTKNGDETSQIDFIVCTKCNKAFPHKSSYGNRKLISYNKLHAKTNTNIKINELFVSPPSIVNLSLSDQVMFDTKIANFVAETISPFTITESASFTEMINFAFNLGKKFNEPSARLKILSKKCVKKIIMNEYECMYLKMEKLITTISHNSMCLTIDIWPDNAKINSFIDISVLFVKNFTLQHFQYDMIYFPVKHTAENINKICTEFCIKFSLSKSDLRIVCDSAANNLSGLREFNTTRCAAHRLHTIISQAWDLSTNSTSDLSILRVNVDKLCGSVHKTADLQSKLPMKIQWDSATRPWRGLSDRYRTLVACFDSLEDVLKNHPAKKYFDGLDKKECVVVAEFFKIFSDFFDQLEQVFIVFHRIKAMIQKQRETFMGDYCMHLESLLDEKYTQCIDINHKIAAFLHPNFKKFKFIECKSLQNKELNFVVNHVESLLSGMAEPNYPYKKNKFDELIPKSSELLKTHSICYELDSDSEDFQSEIQLYIREKVNQVYENPLVYWENSKNENLKTIATNVYSRPASSSMSERAFSYAGKILSKSRYRLEPNTLRKLVVYTNNIKNKTLLE